MSDHVVFSFVGTRPCRALTSSEACFTARSPSHAFEHVLRSYEGAGSTAELIQRNLRTFLSQMGWVSSEGDWPDWPFNASPPWPRHSLPVSQLNLKQTERH